MKLLEDRIRRDGKVAPGNVLRVDSFINHQMDPMMMKAMADEFVKRFACEKIDKIVTIEASGIAPAIMVGYLLHLPVVFAKKRVPSTMDNTLHTKVFSFTKGREFDICISGEYLGKGDRILFIDDFLARGNAAKGILELAEQAGAEVVGMGFLIEKSFQEGGEMLRSKGLRVESLARIKSLSDCKIEFEI